VIDVAGDHDVGRELRRVAQDLRHEHAALPSISASWPK
jgi:hypothetical protein